MAKKETQEGSSNDVDNTNKIATRLHSITTLNTFPFNNIANLNVHERDRDVVVVFIG